MQKEEKNCWDCTHQQLGGSTFLGWCTYFIIKGHQKKKIPPEIVDKGCQYFIMKTKKEKRADKIIKHTINLFGGEIE